MGDRLGLAGTGRGLRVVGAARPSLDERLVALADEEQRLLAGGVGDHLPAELAERVKALVAGWWRIFVGSPAPTA